MILFALLRYCSDFVLSFFPSTSPMHSIREKEMLLTSSALAIRLLSEICIWRGLKAGVSGCVGAFSDVILAYCVWQLTRVSAVYHPSTFYPIQTGQVNP